MIGAPNDSGHSTAIQVFNAASNTWDANLITGYPGGGISSFCTSLFDGKIYLLGGIVYDSGTLNSLGVFDPLQKAWTIPVTSGIISGRHSFCSAVVNGKIYIVGGLNADDNLDSALVTYNPSTNVWSALVTNGTFTPRNGLSCGVLDGKIYVMGGQQGPGFTSYSGLSTVEVFDPSTNTWNTPTTSGHLNGRAEFTTAVLNGKICVMGGYSVDGELYKVGVHVHNDMQVFDPSTNTWSTVATSGTFTPRYGLTSAVVSGKIYAIGGSNSSGALNTVEVFTPAP